MGPREPKRDEGDENNVKVGVGQVWVRLGGPLGVTVGALVLLTAILTGTALGWFPSPVQTSLRSMNEAVAQLATAQREELDVIRHHQVQQEVLVERLSTALWVLCRNGATSERERTACEQIRSASVPF